MFEYIQYLIVAILTAELNKAEVIKYEMNVITRI